MVSRVLLAVLVALPAWAAELKFDEKARVAGQELALKGAGVRKRLFFEVYAIGLYVQERKADALAQSGPKRVQIHMLRDVGAEQFTEALRDGIKANHAEAELKALEPRVKQLAGIMAQVGEAKKGMAIALDWSGKDTVVLVDGKPAGAPIAGEDFYRALLRIWLGEQPVQQDLKRALVGG